MATSRTVPIDISAALLTQNKAHTSCPVSM